MLVVRNVDLNELEIYDQKDFSLITRHDICPLKGKYISKEGHASSKSRDILESERILREFFGESIRPRLTSRPILISTTAQASPRLS